MEQVERRLAAILIADVAGYTRQMHDDEEGTLARLRGNRADLIDPRIGAHRGRIVKLMGDGILVEFGSVLDAVRCATEIQRALAARNAGLPDDERMLFRIGINLGDVIVDGDDIYGDGVNVAARMQEIAPPGGISVSGTVHDSIRDRLAPAFQDLGPQRVKHIAEPVRAYRVVLEPEAEKAVAPDAGGRPPSGADADGGSGGRVTAILSSSQRRGAWQVPARLHVLAIMGSIELDLREASLAPGLTEISVINVMGSVGLTLPAGLAVTCDGIGILGQFDSLVHRTDRSAGQAPRLHIGGVAVMAQTSAR